MNQTNFLLPALLSKQFNTNDSLSTSTPQSITILPETTLLRFNIIDSDVLLKWGATILTSSNADVPMSIGINDIPVVKGQTTFQLLADGSTAKYRVSQF